MVAWPISTCLQKMKKIYQAVSEIGPHSNGTETRFRLKFWRFCDVTKTSLDVTKTSRDVTLAMTSHMTSQNLWIWLPYDVVGDVIVHVTSHGVFVTLCDVFVTSPMTSQNLQNLNLNLVAIPLLWRPISETAWWWKKYGQDVNGIALTVFDPVSVMCESGHLESESGSESTCLES